MEDFLDKYQKSNGTKSKSTISTMKQNIIRIEKLLGKKIDDFNEKDFKNVNGLVDEITEKYTLNSSIQTLLGIIKFLTFGDFNNSLIEEYREVLNELVIERNQEQLNQDYRKNEEENWIDYPDLRKQVEELVPDYLENKKAFSAYRNFLILSLFTLIPPARISHYSNMEKRYKESMKIKPESLPKRKNYIIINGDGTHTFVFNKYKTSKTSGQVVHTIESEDLNKVLDKYFNDYNNDKKVKSFLINVNGKEMSQENITNSQRSVTKKLLDKSISNNLFRHIYLTWFQSQNPSIEKKIRIGNLIGQKYKPTQMEKYVRKKKEQEIVGDDSDDNDMVLD
jgi:hypothetical protein|tara:strand:+ start:1476 stop:2486 length:1011 start_codon:yes stop_codon:yes gene_type:complete